MAVRAWLASDGTVAASPLVGRANRLHYMHKQEARSQFGLRGMLWFVVACSAYFSQLTAFPRLWSDDVSNWRNISAILVAWLVLGAFLLTKVVRGMIVAHCSAPGLVLFITLFFALPDSLRRPGGLSAILTGLGDFAKVFAVACSVSSLVSFPASVARMVFAAIRSRFQGSETSQAATVVNDAPTRPARSGPAGTPWA